MPSGTRGLTTRTIHGTLPPDPATGAILTPIYQSTTYVQEAVGVHKGFTYSRAANPTVSALEDVLGELEGAPTLCFSTGMAAITTLFLSLLRHGDHVVISDVVYGGTVRLYRQILEGVGIRASFVDTSDVRNVSAAIEPRTKLVFIETPANPTLKLTDIAVVAAVAHNAGALLAVDNTFLTAVLQPVFALGADVSLLSTTKYIEGHNATVGGSLATRDQALLERFRLVRKTIGCIQSPLESWLTQRGLKTLTMRLERHWTNAHTVAAWLEGHPAVERVSYPGLRSFPQYELACRQHKGHGGMLSFEVVGGTPAALELMKSVELCSLAENLGAAETLITHPASMTHADIPAETRVRLGIPDGLIRLSVGLEDPPDIIADLEQALEKSQLFVREEEIEACRASA
ncbi:MAG: aminotransferase class I/II-fold pyridoxal phosphate-dependent enzyme [Acidobacteria bacterium]|nr:aminotransferase class I/II-fold pyridoxal phosphate-dependent enzyme [Acidobacteriota bacterium]